MSTRRSFIDSTPIASSIAVRSSGEWTRYGKLLSRCLGDFLVALLVEKVGRQLPSELELEDPALAEGVGVDELRLGRELVVHGADPSGHRRVEVARRLDRLDDAEGLPRRELAAGAGQLQEYDVAQLRLREICDADRSEEHTSELQSLRHLVC